jgi:phosphoribosylformylglycinamidine (FGAM) synthase PurS component
VGRDAMTQLQFEIVNRYAREKSCNELLYAPLESALRARETRGYRVEFSGEVSALRAFTHDVLADSVSETVSEGEQAALSGYRFYIDVSLKPGCLDLEKEYILRFYGELEKPGFTLENLTVFHRYYLLGDDPVPSERFVKDLCNPVIHTWSVISA